MHIHNLELRGGQSLNENPITMKTSILLVALILNTTFLFIDSLASLVQGVNPWVFVVLEAILLVVFLTHKLLKDFKKTFDIDFDSIKVFPFKNSK